MPAMSIDIAHCSTTPSATVFIPPANALFPSSPPAMTWLMNIESRPLISAAAPMSIVPATRPARMIAVSGESDGMVSPQVTTRGYSFVRSPESHMRDVLILPRPYGGGARRKPSGGGRPPPALRATSPVSTGEDKNHEYFFSSHHGK
jgi:hypothetical protein